MVAWAPLAGMAERMPDLQTNGLHYGDNLELLRRYLPDASVDHSMRSAKATA